MPEQNKHHAEPQDPALFLLIMAAAFLGFCIWIGSSRFHIHSPQIVGLSCVLVPSLLFVVEVLMWPAKKAKRRATTWPSAAPHISAAREAADLKRAAENKSVLLGYETSGKPFIWSNEVRTWQTIASGASGSGKSTLIESILQQDIAAGGPVIFIDGKGERKLLDKILPVVAESGRLKDFRLIDPAQPEVSSAFNPFWAKGSSPDDQVAFVFDSFRVDAGDDFFDQHQRVYLENIARILHYSGKRFNFYDVLVAAYDESILRRQMGVAIENARADGTVSRNQLRNLEMSIQNVLSTFADKERVSKIQGLINHMMTYMSDSLEMITGHYDNLLSIEDVFDQNLILYISLNINKNRNAAVSLGRILMQNLQLAVGKRYEEARHGSKYSFASVIMDEFAPFAYQNFATILVTARGANVAFLFALQSYGQLDPAGFGLKDSLSTGPNNTFMLHTRDDKTTSQFRKESGEIKQDRISLRVEKSGFGSNYTEQGSGSKSEIYETAVTDEMLKRLPRGQMQALMSDPIVGLKHLHVHVRQPYAHFLQDGKREHLNPQMRSLKRFSNGLNLCFPSLDLEEARTDRGGRRGRNGVKR